MVLEKPAPAGYHAAVHPPDDPLEITEGWLPRATRLPSPNYDPRPVGVEIDLVVVHGISLPPGIFGGPYIDQFFCNQLDFDAHPYFSRLRGRQLSTHLLIRRGGEMTQYVPFTLRARHAGESEYQGRQACNDFSIGIELEGADETPYTPAQYSRLVEVTAALIRAYPGIRPERIVGHSDISPGRKSDPGPAFDWERFRRELALAEASDASADHSP